MAATTTLLLPSRPSVVRAQRIAARRSVLCGSQRVALCARPASQLHATVFRHATAHRRHRLIRFVTERPAVQPMRLGIGVGRARISGTATV